jgi:NADH-quinone oxidoreductase subunit J
MTLIPLIFGQADDFEMLRSPLCWSVVLGAISVWLLFSQRASALRGIGKVLGGVSLFIMATTLMMVGSWPLQFVFWFLAAVTIVGAAAAITARSPVYTALWFAVSLLGVAGLFLFQGAQLLGVATIVVYAGAIVVTFLFVLMLAQPEGHAPYDRISWASFSVPAALVGAAAMIAIVLTSLNSLKEVEDKGNTPVIVANQEHMANLGSHLFAYHLVAIEVVGTLLLVALVGAISIVIQGRKTQAESPPATEQLPNTGGGLSGGTR